jgi:hypothetical protein
MPSNACVTGCACVCRRLEAAKLEVVEAYKCPDVERRLLLLQKAVEVLKGGVAAGDKRLVFFQKARARDGASVPVAFLCAPSFVACRVRRVWCSRVVMIVRSRCRAVCECVCLWSPSCVCVRACVHRAKTALLRPCCCTPVCVLAGSGRPDGLAAEANAACRKAQEGVVLSTHGLCAPPPLLAFHRSQPHTLSLRSCAPTLFGLRVRMFSLPPCLHTPSPHRAPDNPHTAPPLRPLGPAPLRLAPCFSRAHSPATFFPAATMARCPTAPPPALSRPC